MKLQTTTVLLCLFTLMANAQFTGKWDQTIASDYDELVDVGYDNSGNVYLLGKKANTDDDIVLVKYNSSGKVWAKTYDSGDDDEPYRLQVDGSGNSYIVGSALEGSKTECLAVKYNSAGTFQWDDTYDYSTSTSSAYSGTYRDAYLSGSTLYVVGNQYSGALYSQDLVLAKYTSGGTRTLRLNVESGFEYGYKIKVVSTTIHIAALKPVDDELIYHKFTTSFGSSTTPSSTASTSSTWSDIVDFDVSGSNVVFVNDLGSTTGVVTYNGSTFYSATDTDIYDVTDVMVDGTKAIMTGREWVSPSYRLIIAGYNITGASRSFWTDLEPKPNDDDHQAMSSGGVHIFKNSSGEYVVAGNLVVDDDPNDGNPAINPYAGFVRFNSSGVQQGFSIYEVAFGITHAFEDANNDDVILVGSKIFNLCNPPAVDLGPNISEDYDPSGNSINIDAGAGFSSYDWSTGATSQSINVSEEGTYSVTVTNSTGCPASDAVNVTINPIDQTITFNQPSDKTYGDADFTLSASASSGLTVSFQSLDTDVATVSGNTVSIVAPGQVTIRASQSGNDNYNAAPNVDRTFNVDYLKMYWVGDGGSFDDFTNHWATTSGGSTMHSFAPDKNCDVIFDSNSFSTPGQVITGSNLECHDFDGSLATNSPTYAMDDLDLYGSIYTSTGSVIDISSLLFVSNEDEEIDFGGSPAIDVGLNWQIGSTGYEGTWTITSDFTINCQNFNFYFGTLIIDNGVTLTLDRTPLRQINSCTLTNNGSIVFESGSNYFKDSGTTLNGNALTFKRNPTFEGIGKYGVFGSPVTNGSTSSLGSLVYRYDESQSFGSDDGLARFIQVTTPETMTPGIGYFSAFTNEVIFTGTPNSGTIDVPLDFNTSTGDEANYDGFNLVSNPYPAGLNFSSFINANGSSGSGAITGSVYIWLDGGSDVGRRSSADYMIINDLGQVSGNDTRSGDFNGYLGSFQGFFVKATGTGQTLSFTEDMRFQYGSWDANFFREEKGDKHKTIRVKLINDLFFSETLFGLTENGTLSPNDDLDAQKLFGNHDFNIFTLAENQPMAIQELPTFTGEAMAIPLGIEISEAGTYELQIEKSSIWNQSVDVYLFDAQQQHYQMLSEDESVELTLSPGYNTERYQLILSQASPLSAEGSFLNYNIHFGNDVLTLGGKLDSDQLKLEVLDISGKVLWSEQVNSIQNSIESDFQLNQGTIYLIQLSDTKNLITTKTIKR